MRIIGGDNTVNPNYQPVPNEIIDPANFLKREEGIHYPDISKSDLAKMNPMADSGFISDPKPFTDLTTLLLSKAAEATIFETSIGDTVEPVSEPAATTGTGLTPIVIVGGLLLLLFMMGKGRF